ncbi:MAG: Membrane-bound lytic murein transglycosylase C precursor [Syntrophaceae bacterium PtaU1.Bin231]|nr:MAG: Membrane-bound lytic murein transglycosylase C precursor [Syntrophaceae bacterium PtaU1.Bin231]
MKPCMKPVLASVVFGILTLGVLFPCTPVLADIYRYTDDNGVMHITNLPTSPDYKLWIKERRVIIRAGIDMTKYGPLIQKASDKYKVDYSLVKAVIKAESNFNHKAVSPKGAQGLMQLMPKTASTLQVRDSFEPESNIEGGVKYLRYLMNVYNGHLPLALAAYNAGEKAVARYGGIPPYAETQGYVRRVMALYKQYSAEPKEGRTAIVSMRPEVVSD